MSLQEQLQGLKNKYRDDLSRDEALRLALDAAELHMKFLRIVTDRDQKHELSTKATLLLDEAARLKSARSEDWRSDPGEPLIDLESFEPTATPKLTSSLSSTSTRKTQPLGTQSFQSQSPSVKMLSVPVSTRTLSMPEQILLMKASKLNGFKFPPWESTPNMNDFNISDNQPQYTDEPELPLSAQQKAIMVGWRRPKDAIPPPNSPVPLTNTSDDPPQPTMRTLRNIDLVQDAATDCSVVASLCAGVARAERGHTRLMSTMIFPYDKEKEQPILSPNGKYIVRLNFNGCHRKVVIDDLLPISKNSRTLHVIDRNNPCLLWPALLEKAYLKVRGGYEFLGSNSGTDLWVIAGWIPEQIFLQSNDLDAFKLWERIFRPFSEYGDVMITMGTGKMSEKAERDLGLAGEHDYAVLDLVESNGQRFFLIKNPWINGVSWKGYRNRGYETKPPPSSIDSDDEDWSSAVSLPNGSSEASKHGENNELNPGIFWMEITDVIQNFDSIFLNWNPGLFKYRQDIHGEWDLSPGSRTLRSPPSSFSRNPQYRVENMEGGRTWILLSRHFTDEARERGNLSPMSQPEQKGYMSLYAFDANGERVILSSGSVEHGCFVDSPQTVLHLDLPAKIPYTIVFAEQDLSPSVHTFTISVWSRSPIQIAEAEHRYPKRTSISGSWTNTTAGGNADSPTYDTNPQYALTLDNPTTLSLLLETLTPKRNIHLKLLHGRGNRVHSISTRDIVRDSGDYRLGCAHAEVTTTLPAGKYTIIASTFVANQLGDFTLQVDSHAVTSLRPIPREGAGRIKQTLLTAEFAPDVCALAAPLRPRRLTRLDVTARTAFDDASTPTTPAQTPQAMTASGPQPIRRFIQKAHQESSSSSPSSQATPPSPILLTIEHGTGPNRATLGSSGGGTFTNPVSGVRIGDVDLRPDMLKTAELWLVLQRMGGYGGATAKGRERYAVDIWAESVAGGVDVGEWRPVVRDAV